MLSFDRKRKDTMRRPRNRLNPPTLEFIPCSAPVEQLPFPEHHDGIDGNSGVRYPESEQQVSSFYGSVAHASFQPSFSSLPTPMLRPLFPDMMNAVRETEAFPNPLRLTVQQRPHREAQNTERVSAMTASSIAHLRNAVVIPGQVKNQAGKMARSDGLLQDARMAVGRRVVVSGATCCLLLFMLLSTFLVVVPTGSNGPLFAVESWQAGFRKVSLHKDTIALISSQYATATAVTQDGYDPGNLHIAGLPGAPASSQTFSSQNRSLGRFFYGQCTYWANMRYHQLTGHWIPWLGDAYQWAYQAPAYGWTLSDTPNPRGASIMVFSPYAEGSGAYGHVAVVERVNADGSVYTSNWNWSGAWATQSWITFYPSNGVSFIWLPNQ